MKFLFYILVGNLNCLETIHIYFTGPIEFNGEIQGIYVARTYKINDDNATVWAHLHHTNIYIFEGKNETNVDEYDRWNIKDIKKSKDLGLRSIQKVSKIGCPGNVKSWQFYHDHIYHDDVELDINVEELGKYILYM